MAHPPKNLVTNGDAFAFPQTDAIRRFTPFYSLNPLSLSTTSVGAVSLEAILEISLYHNTSRKKNISNAKRVTNKKTLRNEKKEKEKTYHPLLVHTSEPLPAMVSFRLVLADGLAERLFVASQRSGFGTGVLRGDGFANVHLAGVEVVCVRESFG